MASSPSWARAECHGRPGLFAERDALITEGRAAMWTSYGPDADFVEREALNVGVAPLPAAPDGTSKSGYQRTYGYYISADTAHRQACWQWIPS